MRLLFVGDVMLGRGVNDTLKRVPPNYPWGDTTPVFSSADLRLCNLECVLSDTGVPWTKLKKSLHFRTDAKNVEALGAAGINVVSLANNHSLDYGPDAMVDMIANLGDAGLYHAGAGRTLEEASRPAVVETENGKVAVIAFMGSCGSRVRSLLCTHRS
jgi:poly-gamma-glutamate synthesis protein (capsule biosynthesis protein)